MSQTLGKRCNFLGLKRWLRAGGDLSRPDRDVQCVERPFMRAESPSRSPLLVFVYISGSRRQSVIPAIDAGAEIKSP